LRDWLASCWLAERACCVAVAAAAAAAAAAAYGRTDLDIWIQFAGSTLRQARLCQGESQPFDSFSHGLL